MWTHVLRACHGAPAHRLGGLHQGEQRAPTTHSNHQPHPVPLAAPPSAPQDGSYDLSAAPPFGLADIRAAIPNHCWEKSAWRSMAYLALDVGIVAALAVGAYTLNAW